MPCAFCARPSTRTNQQMSVERMKERTNVLKTMAPCKVKSFHFLKKEEGCEKMPPPPLRCTGCFQFPQKGTIQGLKAHTVTSPEEKHKGACGSPRGQVNLWEELTRAKASSQVPVPSIYSSGRHPGTSENHMIRTQDTTVGSVTTWL